MSEVYERDPSAPRSERIDHEYFGDWFLTHNRWIPDPYFNSDGQNETGIRRVVDGKVQDGSFRLIQHGWYDWKAAAEMIKRCLAKGWEIRRIDDFLEHLRDRRRNNPVKPRIL